MVQEGDPTGEQGPQTLTLTYLLKLTHLTACGWIARELDLLKMALQADIRQMIEGKLVEDNEPKNVEVFMSEFEQVTTVRLHDEGGVILELNTNTNMTEVRSRQVSQLATGYLSSPHKMKQEDGAMARTLRNY